MFPPFPTAPHPSPRPPLPGAPPTCARPFPTTCPASRLDVGLPPGLQGDLQATPLPGRGTCPFSEFPSDLEPILIHFRDPGPVRYSRSQCKGWALMEDRQRGSRAQAHSTRAPRLRLGACARCCPHGALGTRQLMRTVTRPLAHAGAGHCPPSPPVSHAHRASITGHTQEAQMAGRGVLWWLQPASGRGQGGVPELPLPIQPLLCSSASAQLLGPRTHPVGRGCERHRHKLASHPQHQRWVCTRTHGCALLRAALPAWGSLSRLVPGAGVGSV